MCFLTVPELSSLKRLLFHIANPVARHQLRAVVGPCLSKHHRLAGQMALCYFCKRLHCFPVKASVVFVQSHGLD